LGVQTKKKGKIGAFYFRTGSSKGEKNKQATPTEKDLGTCTLRVPFITLLVLYKGVPPRLSLFKVLRY